MTPASVFYFTDSGAFGGAEQALLMILRHLDRQRWRPSLLFHASPGIERLVRSADELDVRLQPVDPLPLGRAGLRRLPAFVRLLRAGRPAIFHANQTSPFACKFALAGATASRVPGVIATTHLFLAAGPLATLQLRLLARGVDRYVAVSTDTGVRLGRMLRAPGKVTVVRNGIDAERFCVAPDPRIRAQLAGPDNLPVVLSIGRLTEQKGYRYLIECARLLPEVRFVIAGDGPDRVELERLAAELDPGRVSFLGPSDDVPALLANCDVFVLPSLYEGLPLSILEAMAAGKPVVATAVGGNAEALVSDRIGFLIPARDPAALAGAISAVLTDSKLAAALGTEARTRVQSHFSAREMVERLTGVYNDVLARRRG